MLDKNQIRAIFIFEFKMIIKQQRQHQQCFWPRNWVRAAWFKKFYKGDESLEDEENSGQPSEGDSDQLRGSSKLVILTTTCCVAEELDVNHSAVIWHLKQTGKVKKLISVYLMSWLQIKKKSLFWSIVFSYSVQQWTISWLDCDMWLQVDFIQQPAMTNSVVGVKRSSQALPKARLAPRRDHGHCLVVCCPSDPLQFSESWQNHYIREVCSANWWDAPKTAMSAAIFGQQEGPNSSLTTPTTPHTTNGSKVEWIGLRSFASFAIFTWPLANRLPLLQAPRQLFAGKTLPQPAGGRKRFPRVCQILEHRFLCYRNKQIYFPLAKTCWL